MTVLLSVAELFPAGSLVPAGAAIVAVLVIVPEAPVTVAVAVNVAVPAANRLTAALILPLPLFFFNDPATTELYPLPPPDSLPISSVTVAPTTALGPALLATIVYVRVAP